MPSASAPQVVSPGTAARPRRVGGLASLLVDPRPCLVQGAPKLLHACWPAYCDNLSPCSVHPSSLPPACLPQVGQQMQQAQQYEQQQLRRVAIERDMAAPSKPQPQRMAFEPAAAAAATAPTPLDRLHPAASAPPQPPPPPRPEQLDLEAQRRIAALKQALQQRRQQQQQQHEQLSPRPLSSLARSSGGPV